MKISGKTFAIVGALACALASGTLAPAAPALAYDNVFTIWDENDFWGAWSDKYYTNHTRFGITHSPECSDVPSLVFGSIGQEFYTPRHKSAPAAPADDHPYAAFLYASYGTAFYDQNLLVAGELQLGIVGPSALGHGVQRAWHKMIGEPVPEGWDSQIKDQLGVNGLFDIRQRVVFSGDYLPESGFASDAIFRAFASLGTVRTLASVGAQIRFGQNLASDFGFAPQRQSTSFVIPANGKTSVYGFVDLQCDALAYDATLGGKFLRGNDSDIYAYPFAAEATVGFGVNYGRWAFVFFQSVRTKDFSDADKNFFAFGGFRVSTSF